MRLPACFILIVATAAALDISYKRWPTSLLTAYIRTGTASPATTTSFYGAYETNDPDGHCPLCGDPHILTGSCTCPAGAQGALRVLNNCDAPDYHGGTVIFCYNSAFTSTADFAGAWQQDDNAPGGEGCRHANPYTGACSCPAGASSMQFRSIVDTLSGGLVGSYIYFCYFSQNAPVSFGGAYQVDDAGNTCRYANPRTGGCSCPAPFGPQPLRLLVDPAPGQSEPRGSTLYTCSQTSTPPVQLCAGVFADPSGQTDASGALQTCINNTPSGGTLAIPAGTFGMANQVVISRPITFRTAGTSNASPQCAQAFVSGLEGVTASACAVLQGMPAFYVDSGFFFIGATSNVYVDHIVLDGNRANRLASQAAQSCAAGTNRYGFNAASHGCVNCHLTNFVSMNAICGTGMEWLAPGGGTVIMNSTFHNNGDHYTHNMWSDGLTLLSGVNGVISGNLFHDNSDVNFIMGSGTGATAYDNTVSMALNIAFAGVMMDNFNGGMDGNYQNFALRNNVISCAGRCHYGIEIGPSAWYNSGNVISGTYTQNSITGACFLVNADGCGTASLPTVIYGNSYGSFVPMQFLCGKTYPGTYLNIAPWSVVSRNGETSPAATNDAWRDCP